MGEHREHIDQILEDCLDSLQAGQATRDSLLEELPESDESLRYELEAALLLFESREMFDPRPGFVQASKHRLVNRIKQESALVQFQPKSRPFWQRWTIGRKVVFQFALTLVLLACFLSISQAVLVTAQSAVPGDVLYAVKTGQEKVQLSLSFTDAKEADLRIRFAERRLIEVETLILEGKYEHIPNAVTDLQLQTSQAVQLLEKLNQIDSGQAKALAANLHAVLTDQVRVLSVLAHDALPVAYHDLQRALAISSQGISDTFSLITAGGEDVVRLTPSPVSPPDSNPLLLPPTELSPSPSVTTAAPAAGSTAILEPMVTETPSATVSQTVTPGVGVVNASLTPVPMFAPAGSSGKDERPKSTRETNATQPVSTQAPKATSTPVPIVKPTSTQEPNPYPGYEPPTGEGTVPEPSPNPGPYPAP